MRRNEVIVALFIINRVQFFVSKLVPSGTLHTPISQYAISSKSSAFFPLFHRRAFVTKNMSAKTMSAGHVGVTL
jgi:hypothetical protein